MIFSGLIGGSLVKVKFLVSPNVRVNYKSDDMKRTLLVKIGLSILVVLNVLFIQYSKASHTMGADLTYQCLGGNTYKITLSFYRDCIGIAAPVNPLVKINSASCGQSLNVTCYARAGTGQEVTPACSSSVTTCNGGSFTGIQEWIYDGIITLPMQCTDWVFSYNLCCRNAAITNITNPGTNTFYIYATLNNTISPCNSSPTFSNKPVPFLCVGQQYCFNHGANDADGDSLSYSLITPKQTANTTVNYIAPYTASNPLNSVPTTTFNNHTGDICLTPQSLEVTVMAVLVKEYRNGVLIGSVERDLQLTVMNCNNNLPTLSGINGTNSFSMTICAGQQTCFNIFSNDMDTGQILSVTWDNGIANATFTPTSAQHPVSTFCWTPTAADISNTPHVFTARVADNACPYIGSQIYSYSIIVRGITANAGPDQNIACSDLATLTASASGGSGSYTYHWSTGSNMQSITVGAGTYYVTASDGTCSATDTVSVTMPFIPTAAFTSSSTWCLNSPIQFTDASTTPGGILDSWYWDFGDNTHSTLQNPIHQFTHAGTFSVSLIVGNTLGCYDTIVQQIVINHPPIAAFNIPNTCAGQNIAVSSNTNPGAAEFSWVWNFGDSTYSFTQSTIHNYNLPGSYIVTLVVGDSLGCTDTVSHNITVYPTPSANAGVDQSICSGNSATLSASGGNSYSWTPGNNTHTTIFVNPVSTTNYIVTVTDNHGCTDKDTVTVIVNPLPTANAGPDKNICTGSSAVLTANGGTSYSWTPGGSTSQTITVNPIISTNYIVTVSNGNGCSSKDTVRVNVNSLPTAVINPAANICRGSSTLLTASGGGTYSWIPTGSTGSTISVNPTTSTNYTVIVTDANGCTDSADVFITVHPGPVVNLQSFFLCSGSAAIIDAGNPGSTYLWTPTGDTTQSDTINAGGTYGVTVTDQYGCSTAASCSVTVGTTLSIQLGNVSFCPGDSALLNAGHPGMSYLWTPNGETTQTIMIHSAGTYGVTVTDTTGCSGSISSIAQINSSPVPDFTAAGACEGFLASFTDQSLVVGGTVASWSWSFGDGIFSTLQNPTHTYASAGTYAVTLQVTSTDGCAQTITKNIQINPRPLVDFSFANLCQHSNVAFQNLSTVSSGSIVSYAWNFGDGSISSSQHPAHLFTAPGNYMVSLQVTTAAGCTNSISRSITIHPMPAAAFNSTPVCIGNQTVFNSSSSVLTGSITNYAWDFGDITYSNQQQPVHLYSYPGTYQALLTVTSNNGCTDTIHHVVVVHALPAANAGSDRNMCSGSTTQLVATGGISYSWSPGGFNTQSIQVNPVSSTTYTVTVVDSNGCQASDDVIVNIQALPNSNAGPDQSICTGASALLNASGGVTYSWLPGNWTGSSMSVQPTTTTNYVVMVTDANGCQASDTVRVIVNPIPVVSAGPDQNICFGSTILVTGTGAQNYLWNPGAQTGSMLVVTPSSNTSFSVTGTDSNGCVSSDTMNVFIHSVPLVNIPAPVICGGASAILDAGNAGSTFAWSTGETVQSITVNDTGTYSVTVTNSSSCSTIASIHVSLAESPVANFMAPDICTNSSLTFQDSSTISSGSIATWSWDFGDNTSSVISNPSHSYSVAGTYLVTLHVTAMNGCSASHQSSVRVLPDPVAAFTATNVCVSNATQFINQSTASGSTTFSSYWTFNDGTFSQLANPSHVFTNSGAHQVTLAITSAEGCTNEITHNLDVFVGANASFQANNSCLGTPTVFIDNSSSTDGHIVSWQWNFGDGTQSISSSPTHYYHDPGSYQIALTTVTSYGCYNTATGTVEIYPVPRPAITANNVCLGTAVEFADTNNYQSAFDVTYHWDLGDQSTSTAPSVNHLYQLPGTYHVLLTTTSPNGCSSEDHIQLKVHPIPDISFNASDVCFPAMTHFNNTSSISSGTIAHYAWNFGDGDHATSINPSHAYQAAGVYVTTLTVTSDQGCSTTDTVSLRIKPSPQVSFGGSIHGCSPLSGSLTDSTWIEQGTLSSWLWDFGDGEFSNQQNPVHVFNQSGVFPVTLTVVSDKGCISSFTVPDFITVFPKPYAAFNVDPEVVDIFNPVVHFDNLSQSYTSWIWNFGDGTSTSIDLSPTHVFADTGSYSAQLITVNSYGCRDTAYKIIDVTPHSTLFAPNCFTPNGDGKNDTFQPAFTEMNRIQVWIFNRWGELLTSWDALDGYWDGYYKGKACEEDVYVYRIKGLGSDGKGYEWTGHVSIVH